MRLFFDRYEPGVINMKQTKHLWHRMAVCFVVALFFFTPNVFAKDPFTTNNTPQETNQVPASSSTPSIPKKDTVPGNVSIDFKDADISNVLRILSLKSGINIVAGPEVQGTITIRLENVPWEDALNVVLRTYGYVYERAGNIIRVTTKDNLATEELVTETFVLNYTTAAEAETSIKDILSERGKVQSVARTNMLVVSDIPTNLHKIREVIAKLDKSTPQAHIDSKIVKTQLQQGENLGIQWTPTGGITAGASRPVTFPFNAFNKDRQYDPFDRALGQFFPSNSRPFDGVPVSADSVNLLNPRAFPLSAPVVPDPSYTFGTLSFSSFQAIFNFLRTRENTKVISNPRITVLNNQKARIKVGTDVALPEFERNETTGSFEISGFTYRETGVVMEVTPHINETDEILVNLKPEVSAQSGSTTFSSSTTASFTSIPNFAVTNAETQVLIKNGETIAIGGLMTDSTVSTEAKVPVLGDMPGIGKLFRSKRRAQGDNNSKVETLFFITVTIVDTEGEPTTLIVPKSIISTPSVNTPPPPQSQLNTQNTGGSVASVEKV